MFFPKIKLGRGLRLYDRGVLIFFLVEANRKPFVGVGITMSNE